MIIDEYEKATHLDDIFPGDTFLHEDDGYCIKVNPVVGIGVAAVRLSDGAMLNLPPDEEVLAKKLKAVPYVEE